MAPNCELKCTQSPRRVPGLPHTSARVRASARTLIRSTASPRYGESLTTRSRPTDSTSPTPPAVANERVQPKVASAAESGVAAATAPSCPTIPDSWVTNGACLTRNHTATRRSSEVNTIASPAPRSTRAASPTGNEPATANHS